MRSGARRRYGHGRLGDHGTAAGVILFFTAASAVIAPMAIGAISDVYGDITYGFWLATGLAALLFAGLILNWVLDPTRAVLERRDVTDYDEGAAPAGRPSTLT